MLRKAVMDIDIIAGFVKFVSLENAPFYPHTYFRYIDDIFTIRN